MTELKENTGSIYQVKSWDLGDAHGIHDQLELPNWAPWLAASEESIAGRVLTFPEGQLLLQDEVGNPLASLSMNQINWDGEISSLPCWDDIAGDPTTYEQTYNPGGNTLVMMSMNVHPEHQGKGFARKLIDESKKTAQRLGVSNLIGSFRPNEYGKNKMNIALQNYPLPDFESYIKMNRSDGLPVDAWLRNLTRNGMQAFAVDHKAMTIIISLQKWEEHMASYKPDYWFKTEEDTWECGEVGSWTLDLREETATYQESNLWGMIWQKNGSL